MGCCKSKTKEEEPEKAPKIGSTKSEAVYENYDDNYAEVDTSKTEGIPESKGDEKLPSENIMKNSSDEYMNDEIQTPETEKDGKGDASEQQSKFKDYGYGILMSKNDHNCVMKVGKFYDEKYELWFRSIYVLECDATRKQFLSYYNLKIDIMTQEDFYEWCNTNGYSRTKTFYKLFMSFDAFPYSRILNGLSHKYEVKFQFSDIFTFKGRGPFRALTCFGRQGGLVDRALNEYEQRSSKSIMMLGLLRHWDNYCFPDPATSLQAGLMPVPPFSWPKRYKPQPQLEPHYPYNYRVRFPLIMQHKIEPANHDETIDEEKTLNNESEIENQTNTHFMQSTNFELDAEVASIVRPTETDLQVFFQSETII